MKVSTGQLRSAIRNFLFEDHAGGAHDEPYDEMSDIFDRAANDPNGKTEFRGPDGYYTLEDDSLGGEGQYVLHDPSGKEDLFYADDKNAITTLEDRIISILTQTGEA